MKLFIGCVVHYVSYGTPGGEYTSQCRAAVVTEIHDDMDTVGLAVINPSGLFFHATEAGGCRYDEGVLSEVTGPGVRVYPGGTWHWPERVEQ